MATKIEQQVGLSGLQWALARFQSKTPKGAAVLRNWCIAVLGICTLYDVLYMGGAFTHTTVATQLYSYSGMFISACGVLGIHAQFQTSDPVLLGSEVLDNINNAIANTPAPGTTLSGGGESSDINVKTIIHTKPLN